MTVTPLASAEDAETGDFPEGISQAWTFDIQTTTNQTSYNSSGNRSSGGDEGPRRVADPFPFSSSRPSLTVTFP